MKSQTTDKEKIFVKSLSDERKLSKIPKEFLKLKNKNTNSMIKKQEKKVLEKLYQRRYTDSKSYEILNIITRYSVLYIIKEMQVKTTTVKCHCTSIKMTKIWMLTPPNAGEDVK